MRPYLAAMVDRFTAAMPRQHSPEFSRVVEAAAELVVCTSLDDAEATERVNELGPFPDKPERRWQLAGCDCCPPVACVDKPATHRHVVFES